MTWVAEVTADAPRMWYRFNDAATTPLSTLVDNSGNGLDGIYRAGTFTDVPGLVRNDANQAIDLDGAAAWITTQTEFLTYTEATIECIVDIPAISADAVLIALAGQFSNPYSFALTLNSSGVLSGFVKLDIGNSVGSGQTVSCAQSVVGNGPHHIVLTYRESDSNLSLYVDGSIAGSRRFITPYPIMFTGFAAGNPPTVGAGYIGARRCAGGGWDADCQFYGEVIDEVVIYDKHLTPQRVAAHAQHAATTLALDWSKIVIDDTPRMWYRLSDASRVQTWDLQDSSGEGLAGAWNNNVAGSSTLVPGVTKDGNLGTAFTNSNPGGFQGVAPYLEATDGNVPADFQTWTQATIECVFNVTAAIATNQWIAGLTPALSGTGSLYLYVEATTGYLIGKCTTVNDNTLTVSSAPLAVQGVDYHAALVYDATAGTLDLYINGQATAQDPGIGASNLKQTGWSAETYPDRDCIYMAARRTVGSTFAPSGEWYIGLLDEIVFYDVPLDAGTVAAHSATLFTPVSSPSVLPMTLSGFLGSGPTNLPMRLTGQAPSGASSLPMRLESVTQGAFTDAVVTFGAQVILNGIDISDQLSGPINITHEEDASGLADFVIIPPAGPIDLNAYERKPVRISFVSGGVSLRRFTGWTSSAQYDPDSSLMTIDCTTDLQGQLENMTREAIDNLIGGLWSEWVFDETADGWQYAQDRLSTTQSEIHVDLYGNLVVVPWKAKAVADVELTDAKRFSDSLTIQRANLRDLLSKVRVNFDFRFTRLRHREITVNFISQRGFCDWANNNWLLAAKDMVRAAADGGQWTRTSEINYEDLPPSNPSICSPPRAWNAEGSEAFCLGAWWRAARRWAQTITEEFAIDVTSPDITQAIGAQQVNADYSVEATYDATDYEAQKDFTGPPADFVFSPKSFDWQKDADESPTDGRAAMQDAQKVAMEVARSEILGRARSNRVGVSNIYDPTLTLAQTVRINTPYCKATGKLALIEETINPVTGDLGMAIELAVSRHGGTGLGTEDPLDPPDAPEQPQETSTGRVYNIGYHVGGEEFAPPDDPNWDGWITNVQSNGDSYFEGAELYDVRFVVAYPEVETEARNELTADDITNFEIIVPEDELEISN